MKQARRISFREAEAAPLNHRLLEGRGYVRAPVLFGPVDGPLGRCNPSTEALDGSLHRLISPQGAEFVFTWNKVQVAWVVIGRHRFTAQRLGFAPDYLSRHGWRYEGAYEEKSEETK